MCLYLEWEKGEIAECLRDGGDALEQMLRQRESSTINLGKLFTLKHGKKFRIEKDVASAF